MRPYLLALWGWLGCIALVGCQGRAYRDLYAENMAAEIRDLEDQLYEYDHQYKLLEQELEVLRQQNLTLKAAVPPKRSLLAPFGKDDSRSEPRPHELPNKPEPMLVPPSRKSDSILEPNTGPQPSGPDRPSPDGQSPQASNSEELPTPSRPRTTPPTDRSQESPSLPAAPSAPRVPHSKDPKSPDIDFDLEELLPPTIDPGVASPPPTPPLALRADGSPVAPENNLEMNLARIDTPTQRVSAVLSIDNSHPQAALTGAADKPTDSRVIELAFHPALSRAVNTDGGPKADGLYLVLQPKNEQGQMVPAAADLMVFALDPAREGDQAKIGRWEFTAAEVQQKIQPIGSEQGIHLSLPWTGPDPTADRVIVFALYKFTNGRQVMGEKEIYMSSDGNLKAVWSPRATKNDSQTAALTTERPSSAVSQASYLPPPSAAVQRPQTSHSNPVVRPANGSSPPQPPPLPLFR